MLFLGHGGHLGVIQTADCSQMLPVSGVLEESTRTELSSWGQKLLKTLLKQGLPVTRLASGPHTTPLHVALKIGIKAGGNVSEILLSSLIKKTNKQKQTTQ